MIINVSGQVSSRCAPVSTVGVILGSARFAIASLPGIVHAVADSLADDPIEQNERENHDNHTHARIVPINAGSWQLAAQSPSVILGGA